MSGFFRHPKTTQERRQAAASRTDPDVPDARGKRSLRNLVDSREDLGRCRQRSWKRHRKTQFKLPDPTA